MGFEEQVAIYISRTFSWEMVIPVVAQRRQFFFITSLFPPPAMNRYLLAIDNSRFR